MVTVIRMFMDVIGCLGCLGHALYVMYTCTLEVEAPLFYEGFYTTKP